MLNVKIVWECQRCGNGLAMYHNVDSIGTIMDTTKSLFCPACNASGWHIAIGWSDAGHLNPPDHIPDDVVTD